MVHAIHQANIEKLRTMVKHLLQPIRVIFTIPTDLLSAVSTDIIWYEVDMQ